MFGNNVKANDVGPAIKDVLKLVRKKPCQLSSKTLLKQLLIEGRAVGLEQPSELHQRSDINTLPQDGTTKESKKMVALK